MSDPRPSESTADQASRTPSGVVTIRCRENGPLVVEMPLGPDGEPQRLRVTDHLGRELPLPAQKRAVALCRCGQSATKPFCDGTHKTMGAWAEKGPETGLSPV